MVVLLRLVMLRLMVVVLAEMVITKRCCMRIVVSMVTAIHMKRNREHRTWSRGLAVLVGLAVTSSRSIVERIMKGSLLGLPRTTRRARCRRGVEVQALSEFVWRRGRCG